MHHADACCCTSLHYAWRGIDASQRVGTGIDAWISIIEFVPFLIGLNSNSLQSCQFQCDPNLKSLSKKVWFWPKMKYLFFIKKGLYIISTVGVWIWLFWRCWFQYQKEQVKFNQPFSTAYDRSDWSHFESKMYDLNHELD